LPDNDPPKKENFWVQAGRMSQVAFVLPAATVVGWLVGAGLDRWLHTTWIWMAGLLLGIVAGFVDLIRTVVANSK
jgi:F0F1-type ATP synthase assembly protein I